MPVSSWFNLLNLLLFSSQKATTKVEYESEDEKWFGKKDEQILWVVSIPESHELLREVVSVEDGFFAPVADGAG